MQMPARRGEITLPEFINCLAEEDAEEGLVIESKEALAETLLRALPDLEGQIKDKDKEEIWDFCYSYYKYELKNLKKEGEKK